MNGLRLGLTTASRTRLVRQTEVAECGLACIVMIASYHGLDLDLGTLRRSFSPSLRGSPLKSLITIADQLGFVARAVKLPLSDIKRLRLPAILHWNMNHYVVVERVNRGRALILDPDGQTKWMDFEAISSKFTGVALELTPASDFQPRDLRRPVKLSQLWQRLTGMKRALAQTLALSFVVQAFALTSPYYIQVAIDTALPALDRSLLFVLATGFGLFLFLSATAALLRSFVLLNAGASLGYGIAANVARRLFRLPVSWFERRNVGDVLSRFQSVTPVQALLTHGAAAAAVDGILAFFTLGMMFIYSKLLAAVTLTALVCYTIIRLLTYRMEREAQELRLIAEGKEQSMLIESLRGITTLRLFGRETSRHALWQSRLVDMVNADVRVARVSAWQLFANTLIFGLENIIVIWISVERVMAGGFSIGLVVAYLAYKTQFIAKAVSLMDQAVAFQIVSLHLERLSDIVTADQDISFTDPTSLEMKLLGTLELKQVSYRYGDGEVYVLRSVDLKVEAGEHIAITGPSGGGKSTLAKLVLGLIEPSDGAVLIDGLPIRRFGHKNYRDQVAAVLQDDCLFAGTLVDNIALFDEVPNIDLVVTVAIAAAIHDDILAMPMAYHTLIGEMGSTLSGGQRQRIFLARALYRRPRLLVIDEGTSNLDTVREAAVNAAISTMGITRIVIAHRLETIRAANRVYVLDGGKLWMRAETYA